MYKPILLILALAVIGGVKSTTIETQQGISSNGTLKTDLSVRVSSHTLDPLGNISKIIYHKDSQTSDDNIKYGSKSGKLRQHLSTSRKLQTDSNLSSSSTSSQTKKYAIGSLTDINQNQKIINFFKKASETKTSTLPIFQKIANLSIISPQSPTPNSIPPIVIGNIPGGVKIIPDITKDKLGFQNYQYLQGYLTSNFPKCSWKLKKASGQVVAGYRSEFQLQFDLGNGQKFQVQYDVVSPPGQPITYKLVKQPSQQQFDILSANCNQPVQAFRMKIIKNWNKFVSILSKFFGFQN